MSKKQVKKYPASLKAKVALVAVREEKTLAQIGSDFGINPFNVKFWKKQFLENIEVVFDKELQVKAIKTELESERRKIDELHRQIGELTAKLSWAKKKSAEAGLQYEEILG
jgi:transposase-like protein